MCRDRERESVEIKRERESVEIERESVDIEEREKV